MLGSSGMLPRIFFRKKWCDLVQSERSKVRYYQPKNQQLYKDYKSKTTNIICYMFSSINRDMHVNEQLHFIRVSGRPKNFFKNQTKWRLFL